MQRISQALTDVGRVRKSNEDAFICDDALGLYAVADGMGGHAAGEIASQEALETVQGTIRRGEKAIADLEQDPTSSDAIRRVTRLVESAVQAAAYMVFALAEHDPVQQGMGTTLSALLLCGEVAVTAQVGDSRIYLVREGKAHQLTEDHTLVAWQLKRGIITPEQAVSSPHKNVITRAVGSRDYVQVDTRCVEMRSGDSFLVCSDGLHGYLSLDEISSIVSSNPEQAVEVLIEMANQRGGRDNITAVVVRVTA